MYFGTNKVLITGANGWLGKSLVHSLISGINNCSDLKVPPPNLLIKCLVLPNEKNTVHLNQSNNISIFKGDLTNYEDCESFVKDFDNAILFHCAGLIHPNTTKQFFDSSFVPSP